MLCLYSWRTDASMGRQTLTGTSPLIISICTSIPEYFKVISNDVANLLECGKTLEEEMQVCMGMSNIMHPLSENPRKNFSFNFPNTKLF